MSHRAQAGIVAVGLLCAWLALAAPPYSPPPARERCKQLAAEQQRASNQVAVCEYIRATDSARATSWSADLCDEPQPLASLCGFWYGVGVQPAKGNLVRRVDGSMIYEGRCLNGPWIYILCPREES